jgi:hypothetical protein
VIGGEHRYFALHPRWVEKEGCVSELRHLLDDGLDVSILERELALTDAEGGAVVKTRANWRHPPRGGSAYGKGVGLISSKSPPNGVQQYAGITERR